VHHHLEAARGERRDADGAVHDERELHLGVSDEGRGVGGIVVAGHLF
jgi:hypothetical protein